MYRLNNRQQAIVDKVRTVSEESIAPNAAKAEEIWNILNIKYSDYFYPDLASYLIGLSLNLKDLCGHIRQYMKGNRFSEKSETYKSIGRSGAAVSILNIINLLNATKSVISRMENHAEDIKLSTLAKYAKALGKKVKLEIQ